jgi:hypothetical protein
MNRLLRSLGITVALTLVAGFLVAALPSAAFAAYTPPWGSDPGSVGVLSLYNASGQQIISGSVSDSPIAAYVQGSNTVRSGDTKATLFAYTPVVHETPNQWSGEQLGASTAFPNASAPTPLNSSTLPVESGTSNDLSIAQYALDFPNGDTSPTNGYAGLYVLRLKTNFVGGSTTATYDSTVIQVTGSTWTQIYPVPTQASTRTTLTTTQGSPQPFGTSVQLNATVSPAAAGTVQFEDGGVAIGSPASVDVNGLASITTSQLPVGTDDLSAVFSPAQPVDFASSTGTATFTLTPLTLTLTPTPSISGTAVVGSTLTAVTGTWNDGVAFSYQWLRAGVQIGNGTSSTYKVKNADVGQKLKVQVTGSLAGYTSATETSAGVLAVQKLALTPKPTISGAATTGSTLSAQAGTWDAGVTLSYKWLRGTTPITGATGETYVLTGADLSQQITVAVTGSKSGYGSVTETSAAVVPSAGTLTLTPKPTIAGTATTGSTLKAKPGTWNAGVQLSYQWYLAGAPIVGATSKTYLLTSDDVGKKVKVEVMGSLLGYTSVTKSSAAVIPSA